MAGDWIKMRNDLADDPAVIAIASAIALDEFAVVGRLHALWAWADEQSRDGHAPGVTSAWLDRKVQRDGFADALVSVGWLMVAKDGLKLPNFDHHNGKTAKVRALGTRRKQAQRATESPPPDVPPPVRIPSRKQRDKSVTREEKRREEKENAPKVAGWSCPDWIPRAAWDDFEAHRRAMRGVPFTDAARNGVVRELDKLRGKGHAPGDLLATAVTRGWRTVFEPPPINGAHAASAKAWEGAH